MGFWTTAIGFADFGMDYMNARHSEDAAVRGIGLRIVHECTVVVTGKLTASDSIVVQHEPVSHLILKDASSEF